MGDISNEGPEHTAYHIILPVLQMRRDNSIIVSPAKQKRDICTAFPAASLSAAAAAAAAA